MTMVDMTRRNKTSETAVYRSLKTITTYMDRYYLDPIVSFIPGAGYVVSLAFTLPYLYISTLCMRSLPLTLAVIYNVVLDQLVAMMPFGVGVVLDAFNRSYVKNSRLVIGFVEGDRKIISEVNRKALLTLVMICVLVTLIVLMFYLLGLLVAKIGSFWTFLAGQI